MAKNGVVWAAGKAVDVKQFIESVEYETPEGKKVHAGMPKEQIYRTMSEALQTVSGHLLCGMIGMDGSIFYLEGECVSKEVFE